MARRAAGGGCAAALWFQHASGEARHAGHQFNNWRAGARWSETPPSFRYSSTRPALGPWPARTRTRRKPGGQNLAPEAAHFHTAVLGEFTGRSGDGREMRISPREREKLTLIDAEIDRVAWLRLRVFEWFELPLSGR